MMRSCLISVCMMLAFCAAGQPFYYQSDQLFRLPPFERIASDTSFSASGFTANYMSSSFSTPVLSHVQGMFCKWEQAVSPRKGFAPRFRLGSVAYTEYKEGKQRWLLPYHY